MENQDEYEGVGRDMLVYSTRPRTHPQILQDRDVAAATRLQDLIRQNSSHGFVRTQVHVPLEPMFETDSLDNFDPNSIENEWLPDRLEPPGTSVAPIDYGTRPSATIPAASSVQNAAGRSLQASTSPSEQGALSPPSREVRDSASPLPCHSYEEGSGAPTLISNISSDLPTGDSMPSKRRKKRPMQVMAADGAAPATAATTTTPKKKIKAASVADSSPAASTSSSSEKGPQLAWDDELRLGLYLIIKFEQIDGWLRRTEIFNRLLQQPLARLGFPDGAPMSKLRAQISECDCASKPQHNWNKVKDLINSVGGQAMLSRVRALAASLL